MQPKPPPTLTTRQERFIQEFLVDRVAKRAAIRAGFAPSSASKHAYHLMHSPRCRHVQKALREALEDFELAHAGLRRLVLDQLAVIASSDIAEVFDENGELIPVHQMDPAARACIAELKESDFTKPDGTPGKARKVRLWSKPEALNLLAKITGLVKDRIEHSGSIDVRGSREELAAILDRLGEPEVIVDVQAHEPAPLALPAPDGPEAA